MHPAGGGEWSLPVIVNSISSLKFHFPERGITLIFANLSDFILTIINPVENILEPDDGEVAIVTVCLSAILDQQMDMENFTYMFSNISTAIEGVDYEQDFLSNVIVISNHNFSTCVNVTIIGNNEFNGNRKAVFFLAENGDALQDDNNITLSFLINILEDDG